MKEFLSTAEDFVRVALNNGRPNLGKEMAVRIFTDVYFHTWELSTDARYFINGEMVPDMIAGKQRSLGYDGEVMLSGENVVNKGTENIPETGPLLVTPIHYSGGPINGYGTHLGIAAAVLKRRGEDIKFILQDSLVNPFTGGRVPATKWIYEIMTTTYGMLRVPPPSLKVANGEAASMESLKAMIGAFRNGETVGLYPELTGTRTVRKGHFLAGMVAKNYLRATRGEGPVLPVGVYEKKGGMRFRFGEPYPVCEMERFLQRTRDEQEKKKGLKAAANYMMWKINPQVPARMRNSKLDSLFSA